MITPGHIIQKLDGYYAHYLEDIDTVVFTPNLDHATVFPSEGKARDFFDTELYWLVEGDILPVEVEHIHRVTLAPKKNGDDYQI